MRWLVTILFSIAAILIVLIIIKLHFFNQEKQNGTLPAFSFYTLNDTTFSNINLPDSTGKIILNFFSPGCEHCQYMATQYLQHKERLNNITVLMITVADSASTIKFYTDYKLNELPNIIVLRDKKFSFPKLFGTGVVPCFFIYNKQKLVKKIIGETKIENLLTAP